MQTRGTVEQYYEQTWWDYRFLWLNGRNLALHFGQYDEGIRTHADALVHTNRVLARCARLAPGERVLDAGCGVGGSSLWLARHARARVVGIALGEEQIARATRAARKRGLADRAHFLRADFTRPPFAPASFDVVWALESLCHAADKPAFFREVARALCPGGRLVVADFMRLAHHPDPAGARLLREWSDGWAMGGLDTAEEHRRNALDAGLAEATVQDVTARVRPSLRRLYRMAKLTFPMALLARRCGLRSPVQHANVVASIRQYQALRGGHWQYGILTAHRPGSEGAAG
jgi:cyclopropane fatty-acyl-phospholipid synthase-like methyltransferase